jgi:hypothetical protein
MVCMDGQIGAHHHEHHHTNGSMVSFVYGAFSRAMQAAL